jgi:hypothetical protein
MPSRIDGEILQILAPKVLVFGGDTAGLDSAMDIKLYETQCISAKL